MGNSKFNNIWWWRGDIPAGNTVLATRAHHES